MSFKTSCNITVLSRDNEIQTKWSLLLSPLDSKTKVFSSMLFLLNCSVLFISFGQPCQTPLSMGFPRQEYWSGLPFPSPGALSDPGIEPASPDWQVDSLPLSHLLGNPFLTYHVTSLKPTLETRHLGDCKPHVIDIF